MIAQALDAGHEVTAFVRSADKLARRGELTAIEGQIDDADGVAKAIEGADAVVSALGARSNTPDQVEVFGTAMKNITAAMAAHGVRRLVAISGAVVVVTPEDRMTVGRRLMRFVLVGLRRHMALAKAREYEIITATDLEWVIVRPPQIVAGPATGAYRVFPDRVPSPKISQGDVADFMLKCAAEDAWVRQAPIPG